MAGNRRWTPQDDEDLLHLLDAGFLVETVAEVLGRSSGAARRRLAELRASAPPPFALAAPEISVESLINGGAPTERNRVPSISDSTY